VEIDRIGVRAEIIGIWRERVIDIDPAMLHTGPDSITLVHRKPYWLKHVIYDFIRLEAQD